MLDVMLYVLMVSMTAGCCPLAWHVCVPSIEIEQDQLFLRAACLKPDRFLESLRYNHTLQKPETIMSATEVPWVPCLGSIWVPV